MTEFDHELIAALAEGQMPASEAAELEARIASDPVAAAELEAQRVALSALAAATPPSLDDLERRRLHRSVAADLDIALPSRVEHPRRRFNVNWAALTTAAAILLGVALVAPVLSLLNTSGGDSAADTSVAAALSDAAGADERELITAQDQPVENEQDLAAAAAPADTLTAAATTTPAAAEAAPETSAPGADFFPYGDLPDLGALDPDLTLAVQQFSSIQPSPTLDLDDTGEPFPCRDQVIDERLAGRLLEEPVALVGIGTIADVPVYVLAAGDPATPRDLLAVSVADCTTLGSATGG